MPSGLGICRDCLCETLWGEGDIGTEVDPGPAGTTAPGSVEELHPLLPLSNWRDHQQLYSCGWFKNRELLG